MKDRSELARLYPRVKSYDHILEDDKKRAEYYEQKLPRHRSFWLSLYGGILFGLVAYFIFQVESFWYTASIAAIFFSFAAALLLFGGIAWWVRSISEFFYYHVMSSKIFLLVVLVLSIGGFVGVYFFRNSHLLMASGVGAFVFATSIFLLQKLLLRTRVI